jgi:hypothetical protein
VVVARLECDNGRSPASPHAGSAESVDLRVRAAWRRRESLADDPGLDVHDHAADRRIRAGVSEGLLGKTICPTHCNNLGFGWHALTVAFGRAAG